jgi:hypothetical protein
VAVVTVVTGSDDDGSTDTERERNSEMTGVNYLEFTVGLGTCGSLIYSRPRTNQLGN